MTNRTVAILLSDKRSGSTMLQAELGKHADIHHVDYTPHTYFETQYWLMAASVLNMPAQTYYGHYLKDVKANAAARAYLIDCVNKNVPDFVVPADDRELVFRGWEALCHRYAQPVFFEKSPQHVAQWAALTLLLEWLQSTTEFDVKVIGLIRNPLAVMYSANELFRSEPEKRQFGWADMYRNLLAFQAMLRPNQLLMVRYEDLIVSPRAKLAEICRFIGVPPDDRVGSDVHLQSANKWIDDPEFDLQLHESVRQIARHFGYTDQELYNPAKPGIARGRSRVRKFGTVLQRAKARAMNHVIKPLLLSWRR